MTEQLIRRARLSQLLHIEPDTLRAWDASGFLCAAGTWGKEIHYTHPVVDAFLAEHALNFGQVPTLSDLWHERLTLIPTRAAADQLGISQLYVWTLIRGGRLAAIRLTNEYRVSAQSVDAYKAARNDSEYVPWTTVSHVLGAGRHTVSELVESGRLHDASDGYRRRVTRDSLIHLLEGLLPDFIHPNDWLSDRLVDPMPLWTINEIALNREDKLALRGLVDAGRLWHITHPTATTEGKKQLILPDSHLGHLEQHYPPLRRAELAQVFITTEQSVRNWQDEGLLQCPLHQHITQVWYEPCVVKVLAGYVTPGSSPLKWFTGVMKGASTLGPAEAADILHITPQEVFDMVRRRELHGLRGPKRGITFLRNQVIGARDRRQRRARG